MCCLQIPVVVELDEPCVFGGHAAHKAVAVTAARKAVTEKDEFAALRPFADKETWPLCIAHAEQVNKEADRIRQEKHRAQKRGEAATKVVEPESCVCGTPLTAGVRARYIWFVMVSMSLTCLARFR